MFVTKRALSRRTVLKGMGTTLALPFLESMVPAFRALAQSPAPMRFGAVYFPNGAPMAGSNNYWMPAAQGQLEITPILKPLEPFKNQMTVVGNLSRAGGKTVTDHAVSSAGWLSGAVAKQTEAEDIHVGVTIDQVLARQIGQDTPFPSLEVATEDFSGYVGGCVPGYSCTYMNTISWAGPTSPLPMEINPRVAFERLFGRAADGNQRLERMRENRSILDSVAGEARQLQRRLGAPDRARLDEYLGTVREIERRIEKIEARNMSGDARELPGAPAGVPDSFDEHVKLMFDLQALAFQADVTRVFSFKMGRDASSRVYPESGVTKGFHPSSHHGGKPANIAEFGQINRYHVSLLPYFLQKLQSIEDGDKSLLERSMVIYGSPMGDSNVHNHKRCPLLVVGGANGQLAGNVHHKAAAGTPMANVMLTLMHKLGLTDIQQFGDSTGAFSLT